MTCREKLMIEHPECVDEAGYGGCDGCPMDYYYLDKPRYCYPSESMCTKCWDREIPEEKTEQSTNSEPHILDSGDRTEFTTGAVRDMREGKGRCDLLPLDVIALITGEHNVLDGIRLFQDTGDHTILLDIMQTNSIFDNMHTTSLEVAKQFEDGAKKYGENNWQKGIPVHCYIDSALRHYFKYRRGDTDEPHDRAFVWNILCCIWTCIHMPELNDYAKGKE